MTAEKQRDSRGRAIREELKTFNLYLSVDTKENEEDSFVQKGVVYDLRGRSAFRKDPEEGQ